MSCTLPLELGRGEVCSNAEDYCYLDSAGLTPDRLLGDYCADSPGFVDAIVTCIDGGLPQPEPVNPPPASTIAPPDTPIIRG